MTDADDIIDTAAVAELLKCSRRTVETLVSRGEIPSFTVGTLRRFRRSAVLKHIEEQEARSLRRLRAVRA